MSIQPDQLWRGAAAQIALLPSAVTETMRQQHKPTRDGRCRGPHGCRAVSWPCSTRRLADAADAARHPV